MVDMKGGTYMLFWCRSAWLSVAILAGSASAQSVGLGAISGTVLDDAGKPVPKATVAYTRVPDAVPVAKGVSRFGGPRVTSQVVVAADGSFHTSSTPVGQYYLCAIGTDAHHVSSCHTGKVSPPVAVTAGQTTKANLTILNGRLVTVHVTDAQGRIAAGARMIIGTITAAGYYRRAMLVSKGNGQLHYQVVIPKYEDTALFLDTTLQIGDALGNAVAARQRQTQFSSKDSGDVEVMLIAN
jgi:Carboxypeptidase regulatory-like domain